MSVPCDGKPSLNFLCGSNADLRDNTFFHINVHFYVQFLFDLQPWCKMTRNEAIIEVGDKRLCGHDGCQKILLFHKDDVYDKNISICHSSFLMVLYVENN